MNYESHNIRSSCRYPFLVLIFTRDPSKNVACRLLRVSMTLDPREPSQVMKTNGNAEASHVSCEVGGRQ